MKTQIRNSILGEFLANCLDFFGLPLKLDSCFRVAVVYFFSEAIKIKSEIFVRISLFKIKASLFNS